VQLVYRCDDGYSLHRWTTVSDDSDKARLCVAILLGKPILHLVRHLGDSYCYMCGSAVVSNDRNYERSVGVAWHSIFIGTMKDGGHQHFILCTLKDLPADWDHDES
jgi:hypothetical protein